MDLINTISDIIEIASSNHDHKEEIDELMRTLNTLMISLKSIENLE
jgi:hypothetical protein